MVSPDGGLIIHCSGRQQEVGDISNVHPELDVAIGQLLYMQGVINVLASGRVHTADWQVPQIFPALHETGLDWAPALCLCQASCT